MHRRWLQKFNGKYQNRVITDRQTANRGGTSLYVGGTEHVVRCNARLTTVCKLAPHETSRYQPQVTAAINVDRAEHTTYMHGGVV